MEQKPSTCVKEYMPVLTEYQMQEILNSILAAIGDGDFQSLKLILAQQVNKHDEEHRATIIRDFVVFVRKKYYPTSMTIQPLIFTAKMANKAAGKSIPEYILNVAQAIVDNKPDRVNACLREMEIDNNNYRLSF